MSVCAICGAATRLTLNFNFELKTALDPIRP